MNYTLVNTEVRNYLLNKGDYISVNDKELIESMNGHAYMIDVEL